MLRKCPYYRYELHKDSDGLFSIAYWIDWQQLADDEMFDGIYVLKTNAPKAWFSMNVILETYKGQPHVERCFETVKQPPICVSPVWLHKAQRIESLLFLVFLALLVISLLQREGRQKVWPKRIPLRPERRDRLPLTAAVLLAAFDTVAITHGYRWGRWAIVDRHQMHKVVGFPKAGAFCAGFSDSVTLSATIRRLITPLWSGIGGRF